MISKELIHRIYIVIAILSIALCGCFSMQFHDGETDATHLSGYVYLCTFLVLTPGLLTYVYFRIHNLLITSSIKWLTLLLLWAAFVTLTINPVNANSAIAGSLLNAFIPMLAMFSMYTYTAKYGLNATVHRTAIFAYLLLAGQYLLIYSITNAVDESHLMTAYYPMYLLPIILLHPSKKIRYLFIVLTIFIIFSSIKRGGFVALIVGLFAYIISRQHIQSRGLKSFIYALLALIAIALIFFFIANSEYGGVIERMASIREDEGSDRISVWATTWNMIQQSDNLHFIFGHGNNAVLKDSPLFLSGHNDFLEAWYDYGFIGLCLYFCSLLSLVFYTIRLLRKKSNIAPSLAMILCIVLVLTNIAHVLIYYFMTLFCTNIGLFLGQETYNDNHK